MILLVFSLILGTLSSAKALTATATANQTIILKGLLTVTLRKGFTILTWGSAAINQTLGTTLTMNTSGSVTGTNGANVTGGRRVIYAIKGDPGTTFTVSATSSSYTGSGVTLTPSAPVLNITSSTIPASGTTVGFVLTGGTMVIPPNTPTGVTLNGTVTLNINY